VGGGSVIAMGKWSVRGVWGRVLSEYGMVLVLLGVCAYFTWRTWGVQHPSGAEAAAEVLGQLPAGAAGGVLVVGHAGDEAGEFVEAVERGLTARGVAVLGVVRGAPADVRAKLDELAAAGRTVGVIVATQQAADWLLVRRLDGVSVISPRERRGADFLRPSNLANVADRVAVIAIIGIGMTMVILTRGIDLSVGSLIALSAVVATKLIAGPGGGERAGAGAMVLGCAAAVVMCGAIGAFSGAMVTVFRVPPFIVTLAVMLMARGLAYEWTNGESVNQLPEALAWLGRGRGPLGLPNTVWLMLGLYAAAWVLMARTAAGRYAYAVGANPEGAYYAAVPVRRVVAMTYVVSAGLAGLGGVVEASRLKSGSPTFGVMAELSVIAAVVVGGTSLSGGRGGVIGTLIGALVIAVIQNGMNLTGVGDFRQQIVLGAVILGAVLLDRARVKAG
jgi:ribose transport system permease protein